MIGNSNNDEKKKKRKKVKKSKNKDKETKALSKNNKMKFKYKHPKLALALKIILILFLILCVVFAGVAIGLIYGVWGDDFKIDISQLTMSENTIIVNSTDTVVLAELNGQESRKSITLEEMSPYLPKAFIAIEDERFYQHHGVDFKRTAVAIFSFVTHFGKSTAGGGSTITQQLVKNITQDKDSSGIDGVIRKVKEWVKAYQIENELSKEQILELYLNLILMGGRNYGVEAGAEYYFNKSAKDLSIAQCAFLAGINNAPNSYDPYSKTKDNTEKIKNRTKTVLNQMKKLGYINQEEYDTAVAEVEAGFTFQNGVKGNVYSSHTDALIDQLVEQIMEEKNVSREAAETYLNTSGLKIYSTQDDNIQNIMETEMKDPKYLSKSRETDGVYAQAAAVIIDPKTGYVVGAVGQLGEKTTSRGLNRVNSPRQTGSSIKPIADVLPAIEEGIITPATMYADEYTIFGGGYDPENYNYFTTVRTVRSALTTSQNIPFLKIMAELTPKKSIEYMRKMGISTLDDEKDNNLALAIGGLTYGISPLEMAAAYASIANDGNYIEPTFYSKAVDSNENTVMQPNQKTEKVCSVETAYVVKNMLTSAVNGAEGYGGTASYCKISGMDVAAKTGTTNEVKDRWLCGFTNYYAGAVYYGFDDPERIRVSSNKSSGLIFANIMKKIHENLEDSKFERPDGVVTATVCNVSGRLASDKCTQTHSEIFVKGKLPETCDAHTGSYTICKDSGLLANEYCPQSSREVKESNYIVEKERLGLWNTPSVGKSTTPPTEYCNIHKKPEEVKPTESTNPKTEPTKPTTSPTTGSTTGGNTSSTNKTEPTNPKTEPTKPTTSPTTGSTTGGNTSSTNKTEATN